MPKASGRQIALANKWEPYDPDAESLRLPEIFLDLTPDMVNELNVGSRVEIKIIANAKSLSEGENEARGTFEITELEVYPGESNVFTQMANDEPEERGI